MIHVHKRYSAFAELYARLRATLPVSTIVDVANYTCLHIVVITGGPASLRTPPPAQDPLGKIPTYLPRPQKAIAATLAVSCTPASRDWRMSGHERVGHELT